MKRFQVFRPAPPEAYFAAGRANPPDQVQYEGVVFTDGRVAVRWLTDFRSFSIWDSFEDLMKVHGHPEYKTIVKWLDGEQPV